MIVAHNVKIFVDNKIISKINSIKDEQTKFGISYFKGKVLSAVGLACGVKRKWFESDKKYRVRILNKIHGVKI